jgi:hypothetical protein
MKHFHETIVLYWRDALENPARNVDPVYMTQRANHQNLEMPFILGAPTQIVREASNALGTQIPIYGEQPCDSVQFESEVIRWKNAFVEKIDALPQTSEAAELQLYEDDPALDCDTLLAYINELPESETVLTQLIKILNSAQNNDDIQYEVCFRFGKH